MENKHEDIDSLNDETNENIDSLNDEGASNDNESDTDDATDYKALYESEHKKNSQLFQRVKKAEGKDAPSVQKKPEQSQSLSREEARLIAKGHSDDDIEDIKFIAERRGISYQEAETSREFITLKDVRDSEVKSQAAAMRASGGSKSKELVTFDNASRDDHKRLFDKEVGA